MAETGDIMIFSKGFGHAAMCYDSKQAVHGNWARDFHLEPLQAEVKDKKGTPIIHNFDDKAAIFKPPWGKIGGEKANYQAAIRRYADIIMRTAKYGIYRAIRLELGDCSYGPEAYARLQKYRDRINANSAKAVSTITCSEAVILCFQLTFLENGGPGFIRLDAAHAMPSTLAKWCGANWT